MNRYGQLVLDHNRRHRPAAYSQIPAPESFFAAVGEQIAEAVSRLRDEILGPIRQGESPEAYRLRGYQAWATAEELILAEHLLMQPEPDPTAETPEADDGDLEHRYRLLAEINQAINTPL
ncbi:MAG: hypothetical protein D6683_05005 [Actinomyces sp.]|nr:MAG: hypothetical protein D6683_05005 [Actinomyces sp.]